MDGFEQAFASAEEAAAGTVRSAGNLSKLAKQLEKAAKEGNIAGIKRAQSRFGAALEELSRVIDNASSSWPFGEEQEQQYLRDGYAAELRDIAQERGLNVYERDGRLIASPSIVRILPADRAVRIDRKRVSTIRPSALVGLLLENQKKPGTYKSEAFLESLYKVYMELVREDSAGRLVKGTPGRVVPLSRIYGLFTSLPGSDREYTRTDFARDLYLLDTGGVTTMKSGAVVSFPTSTGARSAKTADVFTFVDSDGRDVQYYGVRFTGRAD